jgi:hypothetical protein
MDAKEEAAWILEDEKEFSTVNIINTYLRNKMGDDWLNDFTICYVKKDIFAKIDDNKICYKERRGHLPRQFGLPGIDTT